MGNAVPHTHAGKTSDLIPGNVRDIEYLASLPSAEYNDVFSLRREQNSVYYHEHKSQNYEYTRALADADRKSVVGDPYVQCIYFVPWINDNYCVIYTLNDPTFAIYVINLANTKLAVNVCGVAAPSLSIEQLIDMYNDASSNGGNENNGGGGEDINARGDTYHILNDTTE